MSLRLCIECRNFYLSSFLSLSLSLFFSSIIGRNFEAFKKYVLSFLYAMPFISLVNITLKVTTIGIFLGYYWDSIGILLGLNVEKICEYNHFFGL